MCVCSWYTIFLLTYSLTLSQSTNRGIHAFVTSSTILSVVEAPTWFLAFTYNLDEIVRSSQWFAQVVVYEEIHCQLSRTETTRIERIPPYY
jgi:hypothetical protein